MITQKWILVLAALVVVSCGNNKSSTQSKHSVPAQVNQYTDESNLANVTLTPEAETRLGIVTQPVEIKSMTRQRTYNGEILTPPGRTITVTSPFGGTIQSLPDGEIPKPGSSITKGDALFSFLPLLTPERDVMTPSERVRLAEANASLASTRIEAQGQVESAKIKVDAAKTELKRAGQLLQDKVGNARSVDDAKAKLRLAEEELVAAKARDALLSRTSLDSEAGTLAADVIHSPDNGILQNLFVTAGQTVASGVPLFEVLNHETVWIRVPVYLGDLELLNTETESYVGNISDVPGENTVTAQPIPAPFSANPDTVTVNLYYEMGNTDGSLRTGQRVAVSLTLKEKNENLVIPWASVLYDIHGNTWVYQKTGEHVFRRSRVQIQYVMGDVAVLASGPEPGSELVTDGAAELFGTEFGNSK
jgi:RND family efflux transporter MFP subunit